MLGRLVREGIVGIRPTVIVAVDASESVLRGGARCLGTRIWLEAEGGVAVTVTVRIEVLGADLWERIVGVRPAVVVGISATETVLR